MSGTAAPLVASPFRAPAALARRRASRRAGRGSAPTTRAQQTCYMDIEIQGEPAGRLTFLMRPDLCPKTVENFVRLCKGSDVGVDPKLTYQGCAFEPYSGKYTYTCKGRGKHVFGAGKFVERDAMSATRNETPGVGGGTYYGEPVDLLKDERSVVLTIPISGPGFGASRFAVVRVGESPGSLKQRLLANTMVIGRCVDDASAETLRLMTVADGAATIAACGEAR
jgi:cyclophilin family peptidyl-prolyl cis-trans isomerase